MTLELSYLPPQSRAPEFPPPNRKGEESPLRQAWRLVKKGLLFVLINLAVVMIAVYGSSLYVERQQYTNAQTDSNMLIMPENKSLDLVIFGTSHGRNFARKSNHSRVEKILGKKVLNLAIGGGGGVLPAAMMMNIFYDKGNRTRQIVYFIDPIVLCSPQWNEQNDRFARREPFSFYFLNKLLAYHIDPVMIRNYVQSKLSVNWLLTEPDRDTVMHEMATSQNVAQRKLAEEHLASYDPKMNKEKLFTHYASVLEGMIRTAQAHGVEFILIRPPELIVDRKRSALLNQLLISLQQRYHVKTYDHSRILFDPHLFEDLGHLNSYGVVYYTRHYLKPVLEGKLLPGQPVLPETMPLGQSALDQLVQF